LFGNKRRPSRYFLNRNIYEIKNIELFAAKYDRELNLDSVQVEDNEVPETAKELQSVLTRYLSGEGFLPFQEGRDGNFY